MLYWPARALLAAVRLGIFDRLAMGPQTAAQVAQGLGLHPEATQRLLQALLAMGYLQGEGEFYRNHPVAAIGLVQGSPMYIGGIAHHHAEQLWPLWEHIETAIREGRPVLKEAFGGGTNPFDILQQSPSQLMKFLAGMHAGAFGLGDALCQGYDLREHRHIIDVGGGSGAVAIPVAQRNPHLVVTVFDLPPVCRVLSQVLPSAGCGHRLRAHGGDFFRLETYPPGADGALIARVLHNWGDGKALEILQNVWAALQPGGTVLVLENLRDTPDPASRAFVELSNLTMLAMTDGGRERTGAEYERLLSAAGFASPRTLRLAGPLSLVVGRKP